MQEEAARERLSVLRANEVLDALLADYVKALLLGFRHHAVRKRLFCANFTAENRSFAKTSTGLGKKHGKS